MYPYNLIKFPDGSGIGLYEIFIVVGVIAAIVLFRILADRRKLPAKLQNLILIGAVVSFIVGYLFAVIFQAIYDIAERGLLSSTAKPEQPFMAGLSAALCVCWSSISWADICCLKRRTTNTCGGSLRLRI